jgi:alpha-galactosidase
MLDPHTATVLTLDKIWAMCDELIAAHQKHGLLGEFSATIPGTGRAYAGTGDRVVAEAENAAPAKNGHLEADIVFTNPRTKPFVAEIEAKCVDLSQTFPSSAPATSLKVKIPAGKTIRKKILVARPGPLTEGFALRLSSASRDIFLRDCVAHKRTVLAAGAKDGAPFELKLAGFPAAEGRVTVKNSNVELSVMVDDTKITPGGNPWEGSVVELFFADAKGGGLRQFFVIPQKGGRRVKVVAAQNKPVPAIHARIGAHPRGTGYQVDVKVPLSLFGVTANQKSFLFDTIVRLTNLGDAHSGGNTSLSGAFDSFQNTSRFARVEMA